MGLFTNYLCLASVTKNPRLMWYYWQFRDTSAQAYPWLHTDLFHECLLALQMRPQQHIQNVLTGACAHVSHSMKLLLVVHAQALVSDILPWIPEIEAGSTGPTVIRGCHDRAKFLLQWFAYHTAGGGGFFPAWEDLGKNVWQFIPRRHFCFFFLSSKYQNQLHCWGMWHCSLLFWCNMLTVTPN